MRIALNFQNVDPARGGAETYVADLARRLVARGHDVDLFAERWREGALPPEVKCTAVPVAGRSRLERIFSFGWNSEEILRSATFDCSVGFINTWHHDVLVPQGGVHGASLEANARRYHGAMRGLYLLGKTANPKFWAYRAIEKKQYDPDRRARFVAVSRTVMGHLQHYHNVPKRRIHVVPNAIDAARLVVPHPGAVRCRFRNAMGLAPGDLVGLFVGHNYALKGLYPLLYALAARREGRPGSRALTLVVCGGGKAGPFRRLARRLGLEESVRFAGFIDDVRDAYHGCDFFASPTYYDPCSLVVFEALACGLPVITSACNGASEVMTDGREGFIATTPDAVGELAAALDRMTDDDARAAMSQRATALGREQSLNRHVDRMLKVFEAAASDRSKPSSRPGPHLHRMGSLSRKFVR
jgi:UDP-glucose:(heptosyl)LPS alpha-1,3-glucosyltransferase